MQSPDIIIFLHQVLFVEVPQRAIPHHYLGHYQFISQAVLPS